MTLSNLKLNARNQVRQIWSYIESQLEGFGKDEAKDVCPGDIFPKQPKDPIRLKLIEEIFEEEGVQVIWQDELIDDRKTRSRQSQVEIESQIKW